MYLLLLILYDRVGIWPPPQRAPAPAVVHPDRPNHHESEEWGRGGTSPLCSLSLRWATCSVHENHDLGSVSPCQTIPQDSKGEETNVASCQCLGATSPFHQFLRQYLWLLEMKRASDVFIFKPQYFNNIFGIIHCCVWVKSVCVRWTC